MTSLSELVATSSAVAATRKRGEKRALLAGLFARIADDNDLGLAASYLAGELPQGAMQVGYAAVARATRAAVGPGEDPNLTLRDLDQAFTELRKQAASGAVARRTQILERLLARCRLDERDFVVGLLGGELRQGALRALVEDALAEAFTLPPESLRRASMFAASLARLAVAARAGEAALKEIQPQPLQPIAPMLASTARDLAEGVGASPVSVEWKLDGVRVQIHRRGDEVRTFTRQLRAIQLREAEAYARTLPAHELILDGEVIAHDANGRPVPFQDLFSAFSQRSDNQLALFAPEPDERGLELRFFDLLWLDGASLLERPYTERRAALEQLVGAAAVQQSLAETPEEADRIYRQALAAGHEGVVCKDLASPYQAGRRGAAWRKVKPAHTVDLVVLAAEWGHGRRRGLLSNLHLGARDPDDPERFWMLGKTFKGLTDAMLAELTATLPALSYDDRGHVVHVRPELVVEIAFDAVQRSPRYDSGHALRFARVKRLRPDKPAREATTLPEILATKGH